MSIADWETFIEPEYKLGWTDIYGNPLDTTPDGHKGANNSTNEVGNQKAPILYVEDDSEGTSEEKKS